ncbi:MAG: NAD(P)-dependent alcohol dehydrogenase [Thermodesulfobacteriota bacterium]
MPQKISAFVLHKPKDMRLEMVDMPAPGPNEVLVRMKAVGVCGSDVHYYQTGRIGPFIVKKPLILGHESSGEVVQVGRDVSDFNPGDRVAFEPGYPCRTCDYCKVGRYNLCLNMTFMATPPVDGALVEYVTFPPDFLYKIPDSLSYQEATLMEPLAVGIHAARRSGISPGDSVLVLGAGPIGLMVMQVVKSMGATQIIVTDILKNRLGLAAALGATHVLNAKEDDPSPRVKELTNEKGPKVIFETAGTIPTIQAAIRLAQRGGTVVLIGLPSTNEFPLGVVEAVAKELDIKTVFRYANVFRQAVDLIARGFINTKSMITHEFPFDKTVEAFELSDNEKDKAVKVVINL